MITLGILILICALFLIISVLLQSSKNHRMSGVVSGGAETFFGKQKGKTIDAMLSRATAIISVIFCVLILILYFATAKASKTNDSNGETGDNISYEALPESGEIAQDDVEEAPVAEEEAEATTEEAPVEGEEAATEAEGEPEAEQAPAEEATADTAEEVVAEPEEATDAE